MKPMKATTTKIVYKVWESYFQKAYAGKDKAAEAERKEAEARRQMEEELRVKENIDSVPCGKMLPWSKNWKKDYYNTEYSVAGVTVARKTRREGREASTLAARHPCRRRPSVGKRRRITSSSIVTAWFHSR